MDTTYDIVCAIVPAMPPHSRFTCVFKTKTSGLSKEGLPSKAGAWASPTLFKVPKVKNENPERQNVALSQQNVTARLKTMHNLAIVKHLQSPTNFKNEYYLSIGNMLNSLLLKSTAVSFGSNMLYAFNKDNHVQNCSQGFFY